MQGATTSSSKLVMEEACYSRNARRRCLQYIYIYIYLFNLLDNIRTHEKHTHTHTICTPQFFTHDSFHLFSISSYLSS